MSPSGSSKRTLTLFGVLLGAVLLLGSCAHKAKVIQTGAAQFEAQAMVAIDKIDELRRKEVTAAPLSEEKASKLFIDLVKGSQADIGREELRLLIDPYKRENADSEAQWKAFTQKLRLQYAAFASVFASLDKGSLFAVSDVKKTVPVLDKLTAQMAAIADSLGKRPAEFTAERVAIADELQAVRDKKPYTDATDLQLRELEKRLRQVAAAEQQTTADAIEAALKTAKLGMELRGLLLNYERLSVDDVAEGLSTAFRLAAVIPGLDLSSLKGETDALIAQIQGDESLKGLFDKALSELQNARTASP